MGWDPAKDEAAGEACRAYTAANVMRLPGRLHITWRDPNTLQIETDAGTQTRLLNFASATAAAPSWQGHSVAQWEYAPGGARGAARLGNLKVVTTNLRAGYVRRNGAPHSDKAVVTEYFDEYARQRRRVADDHDEGRGSGLFHASLHRRPTSRSFRTQRAGIRRPVRRARSFRSVRRSAFESFGSLSRRR